MGHPSLLRGLPNAARDFIYDDVIVRSIAAQQTAQTNNRIVFFGLCQCASGGGKFKRARNTNDPNILGFRTTTQQSIERTPKESFRNELIKPRDHNAEVSSRSAEIALKRRDLEWSVRRRILFILFLRDSVPPW